MWRGQHPKLMAWGVWEEVVVAEEAEAGAEEVNARGTFDYLLDTFRPF